MQESDSDCVFLEEVISLSSNTVVLSSQSSEISTDQLTASSASSKKFRLSKNYLCKICKKPVLYIITLENDKAEAVKSKKKKKVCKSCRANLQEQPLHKNALSKYKTAKTHACDVCERSYSSSKKLEKHRRKRHLCSPPHENVIVKNHQYSHLQSTHDHQMASTSTSFRDGGPFPRQSSQYSYFENVRDPRTAPSTSVDPRTVPSTSRDPQIMLPPMIRDPQIVHSVSRHPQIVTSNPQIIPLTIRGPPMVTPMTRTACGDTRYYGVPSSQDTGCRISSQPTYNQYPLLRSLLIQRDTSMSCHNMIFDNVTYVCNRCGSSVTHRHMYEKHLLVHMLLDAKVCEICQLAFSDYSNFGLHIQWHQHSARSNSRGYHILTPTEPGYSNSQGYNVP